MITKDQFYNVKMGDKFKISPHCSFKNNDIWTVVEVRKHNGLDIPSEYVLNNGKQDRCFIHMGNLKSWVYYTSPYPKKTQELIDLI